ncbi:MAG: hypothetical protein HC845_14130 [Akkermansiaceae bacterium]|nr:hypothetical protein [Akkermansiaceae bacterium]
MAHDVSISPTLLREPPWAAGLRAARANLVPGLIVQTMMLAIVLAYFFYPPLRSWLNDLAEIKNRTSYGYTAISSIIAGAFIPELLRIVVFQRGKIVRSNFSNLLFTVPLYAVLGTLVDFFFRCQASWFGDEATFSVVTKKVLVDQFIYNPFYAAPVQAWLYDWKNRGFPTAGISSFFTIRYYREKIVPLLFATWGVWIPITAILYSLPSNLQIPLFGLALSMWVMVLTWMSEQEK